LIWLSRSGGPGKEEHTVALALLDNEYKSKTPIKLGWIGDGINVIGSTGACAVTSRGLTLDPVSNAVYSYFKWP